MDEPVAFFNGEYVPASQCLLPMHDLGIVMGASVTDFVRTFHQQAYRLEDHVQRLYRSCKYARISPPVGADESVEIAEELLRRNGRLVPGSELGLVFYITPGVNPLYAGAATAAKQLEPTYVQHTFPLRFELWRDVFRVGVHCRTPSSQHVPPRCLSPKIKNRNRLHMWIGQQEVQQVDPSAMPLLLDANGNITETGGSNFVIYRGGEVVSPRRGNILWGVSLTVLTEILAEMGVPFIEDDLQTYDVMNADEAWIPTTPYCLGPVTGLNGVPIGAGVPGRMWRQVVDRWSELVGKDIYREVADATEGTESVAPDRPSHSSKPSP